MFYAQSEHEHSGYLITNSDEGFTSQYEAFEILQAVCKELGLPLFLKLHPLPAGEGNKRAKKKRHYWESVRLNDNVQIIEESSSIDTYELILKAKYNVIWSSIVGIECLSRGKTPIVLGFPLWLDRGWNIHSWNEDSIKHSLTSNSTLIDSKKLIPYLYYLNTFGSNCRFSNRDSIWNEEGMKVHLWKPTLLKKLRDLLLPLKQEIEKK